MYACAALLLLGNWVFGCSFRLWYSQTSRRDACVEFLFGLFGDLVVNLRPVQRESSREPHDNRKTGTFCVNSMKPRRPLFFSRCYVLMFSPRLFFTRPFLNFDRPRANIPHARGCVHASFFVAHNVSFLYHRRLERRTCSRMAGLDWCGNGPPLCGSLTTGRRSSTMFSKYCCKRTVSYGRFTSPCSFSFSGSSNVNKA